MTQQSSQRRFKRIKFTCQKMVSIVLPRKPSLVSDDRSLGPRIVMNSLKSTCPSPDTMKQKKEIMDLLELLVVNDT